MFSKCRYKFLPLYSLTFWPRIFNTALDANTIYPSCLMSILVPLKFRSYVCSRYGLQHNRKSGNLEFTCTNCFKYKISSEIPDLSNFNPLNPELNPICYLLALLVHHFLHVSRIKFKSLTLRLLLRRADHSSRGVLPTVLRRCVWFRNIKNRHSIYIYDIRSLRVNDLTIILLTWRKWWDNNASK